jgi:DNA-binding MarR family transcriptional regulator
LWFVNFDCQKDVARLCGKNAHCYQGFRLYKSGMGQKSQRVEIPVLNLRTLVLFMGMMLDSRIEQMRALTPYRKIRASDERVFVAASRNTRTMSDIARILRISRQSVQSSAHRLVGMGLLELAGSEGNKRDKVLVLTEKGEAASALAVNMLKQLDADVSAVLGETDNAQLQRLMAKLLASYNKGEFMPRLDWSKEFTPQA